MKKEYAVGPDLIRVLALVLVVTTHSVVKIGAHTYTGLNGIWLFTVAAFYLSHSCVPLFLMLSGYLCSKKKLSRGYYRGVFRVLVPYVLISILSLLLAQAQTADVTFPVVVSRMLNYRAGSYDWYVEMYLGLFLMIPFLNLLYGAVPSRKWKAVLLGSLAILTLLPDVFTSFATEQIEVSVVPDYFNICYPITYYFIGAWIREYGETLPKGTGVCLLGVGWLVPVALCVFRSVRAGVYAGGDTLNSFGCLTTAFCASGLFLLLISRKNVPVIRPVIRLLSGLSLEIYLCTSLTDRVLYGRFAMAFPFMALMSLGCAWVLAELVHLVAKPLQELCQRAYDRIII